METTNNKHTEQYRLLHEKRADYGSSSIEYLSEISLLIDYIKPATVLDYGCGKGALIKALSLQYAEIKFFGYDPSMPGLEKLPVDSADLVINTDVLEHIPVELIPNVLREISFISKNVVFSCHHALANAILEDGTNAHCTVRPSIWYQTEIMKIFGNEITALEGRSPHLSLILTFPIHTPIYRKYINMIRQGKRWHSKKQSPIRRLLCHIKSMKF